MRHRCNRLQRISGVGLDASLCDAADLPAWWGCGCHAKEISGNGCR